MKTKPTEPGYLISIPEDADKPIQVFFNGNAVISSKHVLDTTLVDYVRRGLQDRLEELWRRKEPVTVHPMATITRDRYVSADRREAKDQEVKNNLRLVSNESE
jgi:hypothetical protein